MSTLTSSPPTSTPYPPVWPASSASTRGAAAPPSSSSSWSRISTSPAAPIPTQQSSYRPFRQRRGMLSASSASAICSRVPAGPMLIRPTWSPSEPLSQPLPLPLPWVDQLWPLLGYFDVFVCIICILLYRNLITESDSCNKF
jgi:hypothetical protein